MNKLVGMFCLVAVSCALTVPHSKVQSAALRALPALQHEEIHDSMGQFVLRYVTAEGTIVYERGYLVPKPNAEGYELAYEGEYTYIDSEGKTYVTKYTAGPDGFKSKSDNLS